MSRHRKRDLVWKFEYDVQKRSYFARLLLAANQFINVLIWNGSQDETVSSHIGRRIEFGRAIWIEKKICAPLRALQSKHCTRALGE